MARVWIGLGSNVGDRLENLRQGLSCLSKLKGTRVAAVSSVYECEPVGKTDQPWFLNAAAEINTAFEPRDLLRELLKIERLCGRERLERWGPRTLDLDILVYADRAESEAGLVIPHARLTERAFALLPLSEIAPDLVVPRLGVTVSRLVAGLPADGPAVRRAGGPPEWDARS